ncbi:MAG TPA: 4Fe-4S binding protein [Chloroflexota bacterium]|nr:4Fe-4S binding protein [Chloroflexota bacterium]
MDIVLRQFAQQFKVPDIALPYITRIVTMDEMRLVLAGADDPLTPETASEALGISPRGASKLLESAFRRGVLDRELPETQPRYTPTDFYSRADAFASFEPEGWLSLPLDLREALDEWMMQQYIGRIRPNVERLMAGKPAEGSPGNDSILLLHEADAIIDRARTIAVIPCDCRSIHRQCDKPLETCIQFNAIAEKKLARGLGRKLTTDEAKELVRWADRQGLMHTTDLEFGEEGPAPLCNCCGDDCYVFRAAARLGSKGAWPRSRYVATYDPDLCSNCGACTRRCHFNAFVKTDGKISFAPVRCWGCGLCANSCPTGAIVMSTMAKPR